MSLRSRARFGLLVVLSALLAAPLAAAQLPGVTTEPTTSTPLPALPAPNTVLNIHEGPFTFEGPANSPTRVLVMHEGVKALEYSVDTEGRARLDVAGQNAIADATFVRIEGDPRGDVFTLLLRDPTGAMHKVRIDRQALASDIPLEKLPAAPVAISRPATWPGAPTKVYLLFAEDAARNHLATAELNGAAFLQRGGVHRAVIQIPRAENEWDRWSLRAGIEGKNTTLNATFLPGQSTDAALIMYASFVPSTLDLADGDRVTFDIFYEKRISPLIAERFSEPATHRYRVDGTGPSVALQAPTRADDFRFAVSWGGIDALSGVGLFVIDQREGSSTLWTHWITTSASGATFSGDWGKTYTFRARSLDKVGNPSEEKLATTAIVAQPAGSDDINDPPTARLLGPNAGTALSGLVEITWTATDPDGAPVSSRIELSDDDGQTWRTLYAGPDTRATWDTTSYADGPGYRLRVTVTDGTQSATDVASALQVRNILVPVAPDSTGGGSTAPASAPEEVPVREAAGAFEDEADTAPAGDGDAPGKGVPMAPLPLVGLAVLGAALLVGRRR